MSITILQTVIETPKFINQAKKCMDNKIRSQFVDFIAENPLSNKIISGTGGARKARWESNATSRKRGGVSIIYCYCDENIPIYLFTVYKKNKRDNITDEEKRMFT